MVGQRKSVLVVEDDPGLLATLSLILEEEGYDVRTANNGKEALQSVEKGLPSVILLDMKMPVMDGWQFTRLFRERFGRSVPILVNTAAEDAAKRAAEVDADGYIGKPFHVADLIALIARHLQAPGQAAA